MLTEIDVHGVVLGHSERRQYFGETDRALQQKVPRALERGPARRSSASARPRRSASAATPSASCATRSRRALEQGAARAASPRSTIAYEPIWAIGTGKVATPEQAQEAVAFVRALVERQGAATPRQVVRVLYGGSVKPDNAAELLALPDVDGALVGGASLDAGLVRARSSTPPRGLPRAT